MSRRNEKQSRLGDFHHLPSFLSPAGARPAALAEHHNFHLDAFVSPRGSHACRVLSVIGCIPCRIKQSVMEGSTSQKQKTTIKLI